MVTVLVAGVLFPLHEPMQATEAIESLVVAVSVIVRAETETGNVYRERVE